MIKYHGTPIGGSRAGAIEFLSGRHALVSFARKDQEYDVAECCESFVLDNGAFTTWRSGGKLDPIAVKDWYESHSWRSGFDFCLIPDVIDGTVAENDAMLDAWDTTAESVPVFHCGEPVERLIEMSRTFRKVALGSTSAWPGIGTNGWWHEMAKLMNEFCVDGVPRCKLHGLRMLDVNVFTKLPLHSADSSNAATNGHVLRKTGKYPSMKSWQGSLRIAQKIEHYQSAHKWEPVEIVNQGELF